MPRFGRVVLSGFPHHVRHQGHNSQPLFVEQADFRFYLDTLLEWKIKLGCRLYSFCLMTNHVHIVVDPGKDPENLGRLMKRVAARYTRRVNRLEKRSGTAWNGRFKSSPIDTDNYLMACCRYVELNPVRAGMVVAPQDYEWSSYRAKAGMTRFDWLDEDPCFLALGKTRLERSERYRKFVASAVPDGEWEMLRTAVQRGQLSGSSRFQEIVEHRLGQRVELRGRGRPVK